jgi:hypothetical protein
MAVASHGSLAGKRRDGGDEESATATAPALAEEQWQ